MQFKVFQLFIILALVVAVLSRSLVLQQTSPLPPVPTDDQLLRGHSYYAKPTAKVFKIKCSLPLSYNDTVSGHADVFWETAGTTKMSDELTIDPSTATTGEFKCVARNSDKKALSGWDDTVFKFYRSTPDVTMVPPEVSFLNYSDTTELTFACTVNKDTVSWFLDGHAITALDKNVHLYTNNTLVVRMPKYKDVGVYMCKVNGDPNRLSFFSLEGKPYFAQKHYKNEDSENKLEGDKVSILHELYGNPLNDVKWFVQKDDALPEPINADYLQANPRLKLYPTMNVTNGELELIDLVKEDRAYYICNASNTHGTSDFKTLVRVKGKLDALWPFLGIVAEVIILVAIILIYERRRLKQESEADEAMDQKKPLTSATNDSVRQRKN